MAGKIQKEDIKTEAELISAGATKASLPQDTQVYMTALGINDTLYNAVLAGLVGGGGGINYISTLNSKFENNSVNDWTRYQDAAGSSPVDGTAGTPSANLTISATATTPLNGSYSLLLTKSGSANMQGYGVSLSNIAIPLGYRGKWHLFQFPFGVASGTYTAGDIGVFLYDQTNGAIIPGQSVSLPSTVVGSSGIMQVLAFIPSNCAQVRAILHQASTTTNNYTLEFDDFTLAPNIDPLIGPAIGDWQSYTPTITGVGTATQVDMYWRRDGQHMKIRGRFFVGTPSATACTITLPSIGVTIDSRWLNVSNNRNQFGYYTVGLNAGTSPISNTNYTIGMITNAFAATGVVQLDGRSNTSGGGNDNASTFLASNDLVMIQELTIPIAQWTGSTTFGSSRVEYGSNSGMGDANDTTNFVNDPNGSSLPTGTYTSRRFKTVRFANPIQATDTLQLQVKPNSQSVWMDLPNNFFDSGAGYEVTWANNVSGIMGIYQGVNSTDVQVGFNQFSGAGSANWSGSTSARWRVVKYSNALPVGFDGPEYQEAVLTAQTSTLSADTYVDVTGASLTLNPGVWDLNFESGITINNVSGGTTVLGNVVITDSANNIVGRANRVVGASLPTNGQFITEAVRLTAQNVYVATQTTFKVRIRNGAAAATSIIRVEGDPTNITGTLSNPDTAAVFSARKVSGIGTTIYTPVGIVAHAYQGGAGVVWTRTGTSLGAFATNGPSVAPIATSNPNFGQVSTVDTDLPEITINNLVAGVYEVSATAYVYASNSAAAFGVAITDTVTTGPSAASISTNANRGFPMTASMTFTYSSTGNRTFKLFGYADAGTVNVDVGGSGSTGHLVWTVRKVG